MAHRKAAKDCVKKVDLRSNPTHETTRSKDDENLFARLEELEKREQINNELENEQYFVDSAAHNTNKNNERWRTEKTHASLHSQNTTTACSNTSTCGRQERVGKPPVTNAHCTNAVQNGARETCGTVSAMNSNDEEGKVLLKRVSWKESVVESEERVAYPKEESATIYFTHSTGTVRCMERNLGCKLC